jgi:DNA-binding response OmpR family regulator
MNVLICEDDALIALDLAEMVSTHGHSVEKAVIEKPVHECELTMALDRLA